MFFHVLCHRRHMRDISWYPSYVCVDVLHSVSPVASATAGQQPGCHCHGVDVRLGHSSLKSSVPLVRVDFTHYSIIKMSGSYFDACL